MTYHSPFDYQREPPCFHGFRSILTYNPEETLNEHLLLTCEAIERYLGIQTYIPENISLKSPDRWNRPGRLGYYDPINKIIVLGPKGCRKTLIHEILHSLSYFCQDQRLMKVMKSELEFFEGINEYFTGYVLYKKCKCCFNNWIQSRYPNCNISYVGSVRLIGAVIKILISIKELAKIYFYHPRKDWFEAYREFLEKYQLRDFIINKPRKIPSITMLQSSITEIVLKKHGEQGKKEFIELVSEAPLETVLDYASILTP